MVVSQKGGNLQKNMWKIPLCGFQRDLSIQSQWAYRSLTEVLERVSLIKLIFLLILFVQSALSCLVCCHLVQSPSQLFYIERYKKRSRHDMSRPSDVTEYVGRYIV